MFRAEPCQPGLIEVWTTLAKRAACFPAPTSPKAGAVVAHMSHRLRAFIHAGAKPVPKGAASEKRISAASHGTSSKFKMPLATTCPMVSSSLEKI